MLTGYDFAHTGARMHLEHFEGGGVAVHVAQHLGEAGVGGADGVVHHDQPPKQHLGGHHQFLQGRGQRDV